MVKLGNRFQLLAIATEAPDGLEFDGVAVETLHIPATEQVCERYLGEADSAVYLLRPDQHVAARWPVFDRQAVGAAVRRAIGRGSATASQDVSARPEDDDRTATTTGARRRVGAPPHPPTASPRVPLSPQGEGFRGRRKFPSPGGEGGTRGEAVGG